VLKKEKAWASPRQEFPFQDYQVPARALAEYQEERNLAAAAAAEELRGCFED
jgi:hypothetical protein